MSSELRVDAIKNTADTGVMTFNNDGVITKNKMVAFSVHLNTNHVHGGGTNKITNWTDVTSSGGSYRIKNTRISGFDTTNSRFTAPVSGLYQLFFKPDLATNVSTDWYMHFGVNGTPRTWDIIETTTINVNGGFMLPAVLDLNINDYVEVYSAGGTNYTLNGSSSGYAWQTWWHGYLIG